MKMALAVRDWTVALLLLVVVSDYVDRLLLNLFLEPIGNEFSISDLQRGMLSTAFMIFHAGGAWPIATLVERVPNRAPLLASSVLVWTIFSAATGACMNYPQLVVCRVMVGIGEAVVTPVAQSLLCDLYEPHERSTPLGYYLAGIPLGQLFGYVGGGFAAQQSSWRLAFLMVSAPGIAIAALVLHALHEPRKATFVATMPADPSVANDAQTQGGGSLRYFLTAMTVSLSIPAWVLMQCTHLLAAGALRSGEAFTASLLARRFGLPVSTIGNALGILGGISGIAAIWWGFVVDTIGRTLGMRYAFALAACGGAIGSACAAIAFITRDLGRVLALGIVNAICSPAWLSPLCAALLYAAPTGTRALAASTASLAAAIGAAIGTPLVGGLSDVTRCGHASSSRSRDGPRDTGQVECDSMQDVNADALGRAMYYVCGVLTLLALGCFLMAIWLLPSERGSTCGRRSEVHQLLH